MYTIHSTQKSSYICNISVYTSSVELLYPWNMLACHAGRCSFQCLYRELKFNNTRKYLDWGRSTASRGKPVDDAGNEIII